MKIVEKAKNRNRPEYPMSHSNGEDFSCEHLGFTLSSFSAGSVKKKINPFPVYFDWKLKLSLDDMTPAAGAPQKKA